MAELPYERRDFTGGSVIARLSGNIDAVVTTINITVASGWPSGTNGPFFCVIDENLSSEEKILVLTRAGTTLNNVLRGQDGTTATNHSANAFVKPCATARDHDEANFTAFKTIGQITAKGDLTVGSGVRNLTRMAVGPNDQMMIADSTAIPGVRWGVLPDNSISDIDMISAAVQNALKAAALTVAWSPGDLKVSARTTPEAGWALCDGGTLSRAANPLTFAAIGTTHGAGDGSTTFNKPDYRGKAILGAGTGTGLTARALGQTGGEETHVNTIAEMPAHTHIQDPHTHIQDPHTHTQNAHNHTQNAHQHLASGAGVLVAPGLNATLQIQGSGGFINTTIASAFDTGLQTATNNAATATTQNQTATNQTATATSQNNGGGGAHNNMPPWGVANVFMKID